MLEGTKKLFPHDYDEFKAAMIEAAESDELPVVLSLNKDKGFTLENFRDLFLEFKRDTSLEITANLYMCEVCDDLHVIIQVDYPEELSNSYLQ